MVVEVTAVAVAMWRGAHAGLEPAAPPGGSSRGSHPYHAARADLLRRTHQREAAADAYASAWDLCTNSTERAYLRGRLGRNAQHMR